jgi:hypothetical protein
MSWDKNTVNLSKLDEVANILNILEIPYTISVIETVDGWGFNDQQYDENGPVGHSKHNIRRLASEKIVVLECIRRLNDCDADDTILSYTYKAGEEPKDWMIEDTMDEIEDDQ